MLHVGGASLSHYVRLLALLEAVVCSMRPLIAGLAALTDVVPCFRPTARSGWCTTVIQSHTWSSCQI